MYYNLGIIGFPLHHTLSPALHTYFLSKSRINGGYNCFEVEEENISKIIHLFKSYNFRGFNITVPYKKKIFKFLDTVEEEAEIIDAVNTVVISQNGKLNGYNTDIYGFTKTLLLNNINLSGKSVTVLGSGGSTKTVLAALKKYNYKSLSIIARTPSKAEEICDRMSLRDCNISDISILNIANECDIMINTTSLGLNGDPFLNLNNIVCNEAAVDLQYNLGSTPFLKEFSTSSVKKVDGITMLIYQGLKAFELWTNSKIEININKITKRLGVI